METTPQLSLADLASLANIIEAAVTRGAFRANELSMVGSTYDKLSAFVQAAQSQGTPEQTTQGEV